jgi:hypothetical protein
VFFASLVILNFPSSVPLIGPRMATAISYKDLCLKLEEVRRNDTVGPAAAIPCRRSFS